MLERECQPSRAVEEARRAYERAIQGGSIDAGINLGVLLADRLVPPDPVAARAVLEQATERALAEQKPVRGSGRLDLATPGVTTVSFFQEMARTLDHMRAPLILGIVLYAKIVPADLAGARDALRLASRWGNVAAADHLIWVLHLIFPDMQDVCSVASPKGDAEDLLFERGLVLSRLGSSSSARAEGRRALEAAAAEGHLGAAIELGDLLVRTCPGEPGAARAAYEMAAGTGSPEAARKLGLLLWRQFDPPEVRAATIALECAKVSGDVEGTYQLGLLFC